MQIKDLLDRDHSLEAELILAHVLGVDKEYLITHNEEQLPENLLKLFEHYLARVKQGEPLAYITNEKEFFGLNFYVDDRVLIPRPETEHLVEKIIDFIEENDDGHRRFKILDVGTGSGNIAIALAKYFKDQENDLIEEIVALDISEGAVDVANINAEQHGVEDVVRVYQSDLLGGVENGERFDVIVANLPYIGTEKHRYVSENAEKFEPSEALFGGEDGLQLYKKMFQEMFDKAVNASFIAGEFGFSQGEPMAELLDNYFEQQWEIEKDLAGIERIFTVKL